MPPVRVLLLALVLASLSGCADDGTAAAAGDSSSSGGASEGSGSGGPTGSSGSGPTPTSAGEGSSSGGDATTDPGFDPPAPACGNGYVEAGEECDDGNRDDGDACSSICEVPCGLELEVLELAPTAQSNIDGLQIAGGADGGFVVLGTIREITVDQEMNSTVGPRQILVLAYDAAGEQLWQRRLGPPMGDAAAAGVALDGDGNIAVIGSVDGADMSDIWVLKLDAASEGEVIWQRTVDGALMGSADFGTGITTTSAGDIIAAGQIRDGDKDANVWVRKYEGASGDTFWTTTWSGAAETSVDSGGPVRVAPDGSVYVVARAYADADTTDATLIKFGPDGGEALWTATPLAGGAKHKHERGPLAVGPGGEVLFGVRKSSGEGPDFWLYQYGPDGGAPNWSRIADDFAIGGESWRLAGVDYYPDGSILLGGDWFDDITIDATGWYEVWSARLDGDGVKQCQTTYRSPGEDLAPPSVGVASFVAGAGGFGLATGTRIESDESAVWAGVFRPL